MRCDTPLQEGYLSNTCAIPHANKQKGCDTPLQYYLEKVLRDMGGVSRSGRWAHILVRKKVNKGVLRGRGLKALREPQELRARLSGHIGPRQEQKSAISGRPSCRYHPMCSLYAAIIRDTSVREGPLGGMVQYLCEIWIKDETGVAMHYSSIEGVAMLGHWEV